jgi:hypothetical protein
VPFQSTATRWALYDEPDDGTPALGAYDPKDPNIPTFEDKMAKPAGFGGHSTAGTFGSDRSMISRSRNIRVRFVTWSVMQRYHSSKPDRHCRCET